MTPVVSAEERCLNIFILDLAIISFQLFMLFKLQFVCYLFPVIRAILFQ